MNRLKKFFYNATLLTLTALLMRVVSLAFNVWISNKVGAEALGLYSLISSVYSFALTLATSGIALAVTRMVAEALGHDDDALVRASMRRCIVYAMFFGILSSVLLLSLSEFIGIRWLQDERTITPLRLMSITLPLIAFCSALNGYFSAVRRVVKNAASQILEQAVKISATVIFLTLLLPDGIEYACIALVLGGAVSEGVSCLVMCILFLFDRHRYISKGKPKDDGKTITKRLLGIALPVAFSAYVRSGLLTLEHILIPIGLRKSGATRERSLAAYGTLSGMALPVIFFPMALITSFAGMTIPEISDCIARGHTNRIRYIAGRVWQFSLLFSIGIAGILICFADELGKTLYSNSEAALYIRLLAPLIPVMFLDHTTDALLKGLGQQLYAMNVNIVDASLSVLLVWLLVPIFGINGYIFVIIAMELLNFGLSATRMLNISGMKPKLFGWVIKPLFSITASTFLTRTLFSFFHPVLFPAWLTLTLHILLTALLYFLLLALTGAFNSEDKAWLKSIFTKKQNA